jgi:anti-anti-sigma factor
MTLKIRVEDTRPQTKTLVLAGRLDHESVEAFDERLEAVLGSTVMVVVFDLAELEYITSAGLRSMFLARKVMSGRGGKCMLVNPQPQVLKVLEIVKVPELGAVFRSVEELDAYLDVIQKQVMEGE